MAEIRARFGFAGFEEEQEFGMICRCLFLPNPKVCSTHTDFPVFVRRLVFAVSSVTPKRESLHLPGA
jgi:hypothetical protein